MCCESWLDNGACARLWAMVLSNRLLFLASLWCILNLFPPPNAARPCLNTSFPQRTPSIWMATCVGRREEIEKGASIPLSPSASLICGGSLGSNMNRVGDQHTAQWLGVKRVVVVPDSNWQWRSMFNRRFGGDLSKSWSRNWMGSYAEVAIS